MAKYTGADVTVTFDGNVITQYVTDIGGISVEAVLEESHTFGDSWAESLFAGLKKVGDITISGFYDDAALGPDALFIGIGNTTPKTLIVLFGAAKSISVGTIIKSYTRTPVRGGLTKYSVVLTPTGTTTEA